jgi:hypothetical protein
MPRSRLRAATQLLGAGLGVAGGVYAAHAVTTWRGYGRVPAPGPDEDDELLDRVMPAYEVVERHGIHVAAAADVTFESACTMDLFHQPLVQALFTAREWLLGADADVEPRPRGLLAEAQSMGWVVLAEHPGREVVMGAVTRPWEPNPVFRSVGPLEFSRFAEPGYVKIAWTLRADPLTDSLSRFRTETRVATTSPDARARFRVYWALLSPGIRLIRWMSLPPLKAAAEARAKRASAASFTS